MPPVLLTLALLAAGADKPDSAKHEGAKREATAAVDWQEQVLKATGSGAPDMRSLSPAQARLGAENAAKLDALRNLIAQAKGLHISAERTVGDAMAKDEVRGRVEGVVRDYRVVKKRYFSDQGVEMDVEVPLSGIAQAVLPPPEPASALARGRESRHTGLVVDARSLGVQPALAPRLLDASGTVLYAPEMMAEAARKSAAPARYFKTLELAAKAPSVGSAPLLIKATKAHGSDLVVGPAEAKAIQELPSQVLADGRVAIVP
jgi:hypothetical protein